MNKLLTALILTATALTAQAKDPIVIKGIYIGMSETEYKSIISVSHAELKKQCLAFNKGYEYLCQDKLSDTITIGGVDTSLNPTFEGGILKSVSAGYLQDGKGDSYLKIKQAIQTKYSGLKCNTTEVRNRMNAKFDAQVCWYNDGKSHVRIAFRDGSVDYSTFQLFDDAWNSAEKAKTSGKVNKDI